MPTYEYECEKCGLRFDRRQSMSEQPLVECPECGGKVHRLISGGAGFIIKGAGHGGMERHKNGCSLESSGQTCCGRDKRCEKPPCGGES